HVFAFGSRLAGTSDVAGSFGSRHPALWRDKSDKAICRKLGRAVAGLELELRPLAVISARCVKDLRAKSLVEVQKHLLGSKPHSVGLCFRRTTQQHLARVAIEIEGSAANVHFLCGLRPRVFLAKLFRGRLQRELNLG